MKFIPILFLSIATYTDIKNKQIKNKLTYTLILLGLAFNTWQSGFNGLWHSLEAIIIALAIVALIPGFKHGGGDIKLVMGIGAFLGVSNIFLFLLIFFLLSLILNNALIIKNRGFSFFKNAIINEILTFGGTKNNLQSVIGAPIMFAAYLITLLFIMKEGITWII